MKTCANSVTCALAFSLSLLFVSDLCAKDYPAYTQPIEHVQLTSGKILRDFQIRKFERTYVMARWSGGAGTVAYSELPSDLVTALTDLIPTQSAPSAVSVIPPATTSESRGTVRPDSDKPPAWPEPVDGNVGNMDGPGQTIHGQCFIVTQGGNNIKLALVTVHVVAVDALDDLADAVGKKIKPRLDYWEALAKMASSQGNHDLAIVYLEQATDDILKSWELLPPGPQAKTDADGKFELQHNLRPPFVVIANAKRRVGGEVEHYQWQVPSSQIAPGDTLMLTNDNLKE
jgi:hypothetical protein